MSNCIDCGTPIRSGQRCRMHALEHQHGTLSDGGTIERAERPQCEVCNKPILEADGIKEVRGEPAHADCGGQARCDGGRKRLVECSADDCDEEVPREDACRKMGPGFGNETLYCSDKCALGSIGDEWGGDD